MVLKSSLVIYQSERFVVSGNTGWRIVVTDRQHDKAYVVMYRELKKFRDMFDKLKVENKDIFIVSIIASPNAESKAY